jgi:hypothetical protein
LQSKEPIMNRFIHAAAFSSCLAVAACGAASPSPSVPPSAPAAASLDGKSYEVNLQFPGEAPIKDVLSFDSGKFESSACTSLGFPKWTDYRAEPNGGAIAFHVETHNPKGPSVEWDGTVAGASAAGKAKRTIEGKTDLGTFAGSAR